MNRLELIKELSKHLPRENDAKTAVYRIFEIMTQALRNRDKVVISSFGTFTPREKMPSVRRNPKTNEKVMTGIRKKVRFKPSKKLLNSI